MIICSHSPSSSSLGFPFNKSNLDIMRVLRRERFTINYLRLTPPFVSYWSIVIGYSLLVIGY